MVQKNVRQRVLEVIREQLAVEPEQLIDAADLVNDLGADSLDVVEVWMMLEEELGIEISDPEWDNVKTVGDAVKCAKSAVAAI